MNPEIKALWIEKLESGEYKQGRFLLRSEDNHFCCLGVLCDLAEKAGVVSSFSERSPYRSMYVYNGEANFLPKEVMDWAELPRRNPLTQAGSLSMLNDIQNFDFKMIADRIRKDF